MFLKMSLLWLSQDREFSLFSSRCRIIDRHTICWKNKNLIWKSEGSRPVLILVWYMLFWISCFLSLDPSFLFSQMRKFEPVNVSFIVQQIVTNIYCVPDIVLGTMDISGNQRALIPAVIDLESTR